MSASKNNSVKKGLGRGFESLIPSELLDESFDPTASQDQQVSELRLVKLEQITIDPDQPRKHFEQEALDELAESIREHGVLQPLILVPNKDGYQIVAGERRYRAAKLAGLDKVPSLIRTLSNQHKLEISLIENLQRRDLNVMETATAYLKLRDQFNLTLEQIGKRVGDRSVSAVSNKLRLLKLPKLVRDLLVEGRLTEGQVRPLIGLDDKLVESIISRVLKEDWSARKIEQFAVNLKKEPVKAAKTNNLKSQPFDQQIKTIKSHLKTEVNIQVNSKGAGRITIKFKNESEFERLEKLLS